MNCPRCQGLMVTIKLEDFKSTTNPDPSEGWRCVLCGEIIDAGIVSNRKGPQDPMRIRDRPS